MWTNADGSGNPEAINPTLENQYPMTVSPDGKSLVFRHGPAGDFSFAVQSLEGDRSERRPLLSRPGEFVTNAQLSPDGRWLAYQAGKTDAPEVYVQPFPNVDSGRWLVSTHGGSRPVWSRNGRELFYQTADDSHIASVPITPGATFAFGRAQDIVDVRRFVMRIPSPGSAGDSGRSYDVSPDGQRFLVLAPADNAPQQIVVIEHWLDEFSARK
jgi:dipeptidyl aminopeptidase/acylaminoacyl peptidase